LKFPPLTMPLRKPLSLFWTPWGPSFRARIWQACARNPAQDPAQNLGLALAVLGSVQALVAALVVAVVVGGGCPGGCPGGCWWPPGRPLGTATATAKPAQQPPEQCTATGTATARATTRATFCAGASAHGWPRRARVRYKQNRAPRRLWGLQYDAVPFPPNRVCHLPHGDGGDPLLEEVLQSREDIIPAPEVFVCVCVCVCRSSPSCSARSSSRDAK